MLKKYRTSLGEAKGVGNGFSARIVLDDRAIK